MQSSARVSVGRSQGPRNKRLFEHEIEVLQAF